jgi:regulator of cell morphogenesis and NO signaling
MPSIGELVAERPQRGRLFESLGIDYCCTGRMSLEEACAKRGLNLDQVKQQLRAADSAETGTDEPDWTRVPLSQLADHIFATHHTRMRAELPRAERIVAKVASVHGHRHPELVRLHRAFEAFAAELLSHMHKEDAVLFPLIRHLDSGQAQKVAIDEPVRAMMAEHDEAGEALRQMRHLTDGFAPPADACSTYRVMLQTLREIEADLHVHVHKENNILFPRARALAGEATSHSSTN